VTEIAQLFESALRQNRANLLRKAAINTVAKMPAHTTLHELLTSEAGSSIRELTLVELREALAGFVQAAGQAPRRASEVSGGNLGNNLGASTGNLGSNAAPESREARLYRQIIEAVGSEPKTIGQLAKVVDVDVVELRGYLAWMKKMGKIDSSGRARATRYHLRAG
jgi:predicted Rossmann fold nucleotide-binding protein DprA/Smf involved in DNA uptake